MLSSNKIYTLIGSNGKPYSSALPGTFGVIAAGKLYGRLDCRAALQAIARGGYVKHRVFFADEATAIAAGYRHCAVCLPSSTRKKTQPVKSTRRLRQVPRIEIGRIGSTKNRKLWCRSHSSSSFRLSQEQA